MKNIRLYSDNYLYTNPTEGQYGWFSSKKDAEVAIAEITLILLSVLAIIIL